MAEMFSNLPLTGFTVVAAVIATLVCCLWSVGEFIATYRRQITGRGMSCIPAVPAIAPLLGPLMYVRSFRGAEVPWPGAADTVLALLIMFVSLPGSFVVGSLVPRLFAEKAADSSSAERHYWMLSFTAWLMVTIGVTILVLANLPWTPAISKEK